MRESVGNNSKRWSLGGGGRSSLMPFLPAALESVSQAPRPAPCQPSLPVVKSAACLFLAPLPSPLSSPRRLSPLISASHDLTIFPFMFFFLRWYESLFHESNSSFMFQLRKQRVKEKEKKKTRPLGRFLLELTPAAVCKCRQTYLGFTQWRLLPSMKTCSIVPFKGLCMAKRGGGCIKIKRTKRGRCGWPHTVTDSVISSEIPPPPHLPSPPLTSPPSLCLSAVAWQLPV